MTEQVETAKDVNAGFEGVDGVAFGRVMGQVMDELARQRVLQSEGRFKFTPADDGVGNTDRLAMLVEEVGEVAQEVLTQDAKRLARDTDGTEEGLRKEITQVAAIAVAWLMSECNPLPKFGA